MKTLLLLISLILLISSCNRINENNEILIFSYSEIEEALINKAISYDTIYNKEAKTIAFTVNKDLFLIKEGQENISASDIFTGVSNIEKIKVFKNIYIALHNLNLYFIDPLINPKKKNSYLTMLKGVKTFEIFNDKLYFIYKHYLCKFSTHLLTKDKNALIDSQFSQKEFTVPLSGFAIQGQEINLLEQAQIIYSGNSWLNPVHIFIEKEALKVVFSDGNILDINDLN